MDVQLQDIIDRIKADGVATAEEEAAQIIKDAESKAQKIIDDANKKSDAIIANGNVEAKKFESAAEDAIAQASRNAMISFRDGVEKELNSIIKTQVKDAYTPEILGQIIPEVVKAWANKSDVEELQLLLGEEDLNKLKDALVNTLKYELEQGLTIQASGNVSGGFHVGVKGGAAYYDYSADALAEIFGAYLNPRVAAIMKGAAADEDAK